MLERVLYVDDDEALTELAELVLEAAGLAVLICDGADAALAGATDFAPQLLLLDKEMPGRDGPATLRALRELPVCRTVPAVFLTAETDPATARALLNAGAVAVLRKPIDPATLAGELKVLYATAVGA